MDYWEAMEKVHMAGMEEVVITAIVLVQRNMDTDWLTVKVIMDLPVME